MPLRSADFRFKNVFGRRIHQKSALRSRILSASTELMHRPTSDSSLHFDIKNTYQIRNTKMKCQRSASASRNPARALAVGLPRQDHVKFTTDQFVGFHKNEFDEMPCKLKKQWTRTFVRTNPNPALSSQTLS